MPRPGSVWAEACGPRNQAAPEPLVIVDDVKRCPERALVDRFLEVGGVCFGTLQQAAVAQGGIKSGFGQARLDDVILRDVFVLSLDGAQDRVHKLAQIAATRILRRDNRIG